MSAVGDTASCGHPNPVWYVDSPFWNDVVGGDPNREAGGVLCPSCFAQKADERFSEKGEWKIVAWRLVPDVRRVAK